MNCFFKRIVILLVIITMNFSFVKEGLADEIVLEPKQSLKYLDVNVFNAYISELINDNKEYIE